MENKKKVQVIREGVEFTVQTTEDPTSLLLVHRYMSLRISYHGQGSAGRWLSPNNTGPLCFDDILSEFAKKVLQREKDVQEAEKRALRERAYAMSRARDVALEFEALQEESNANQQQEQ